MSGFVAIYGSDHVAPEIINGLLVLQHRGQDAAGIITYDGQKLHVKRGQGLVSDVFQESTINKIPGAIGIGHIRSHTLGNEQIEATEPLWLYSPYGLVIAGHGQIINHRAIKKDLFEKHLRFLNTGSDMEMIMHIFASDLRKLTRVRPFGFEVICDAVKEVFTKVQGSYSLVIYLVGQGLIGFRSPSGIRPAIWGKRQSGLQTDYIMASEKVALDILGFESKGDIQPGEVIYIDPKRKVWQKKIMTKPHTPCVFEYIYFARPDSFLDDISVYKTHLRLGDKLFKKVKQAKLPIDLIVPIPDSGRTVAITLAEKLGIPYAEGLIKNRYIGRTFIMSGQKNRQRSIRYKLNPSRLILKGKNVLLVDDSIIRGTTARQIIQLVREAGAKKVFFATMAPPLKFPCLYGINMPARKHFAASGLDTEGVRKLIGADYLIYQSLADTLSAAQEGNKKIKKFCAACFNGDYPTGHVTEETLAWFDNLKDLARAKEGEKDEQLVLL